MTALAPGVGSHLAEVEEESLKVGAYYAKIFTGFTGMQGLGQRINLQSDEG